MERSSPRSPEVGNMIFIELVFAMAVSLFLTVVFAVISRRPKTRRQVLLFFLIIFFGAWAGGIWLTPVGPVLLGAYWLSFFVVGLIFALVLEAVAAFSRPQREPQEIQSDVREEGEIESVLGVFIWILLAVLVLAVVLGYIHRLHS
jgi:energy-coupling factor transporter transmembrane protein EcfT